MVEVSSPLHQAYSGQTYCFDAANIPQALLQLHVELLKAGIPIPQLTRAQISQ
jgi:hypothetical protein